MESNNPDICFVCEKELGKLYWANHFCDIGISLVWVNHYKKNHADKIKDLEWEDHEK